MFILDHEIILEMDMSDARQQQQFNSFYQYTFDSGIECEGVRVFNYQGRTVLTSDDFVSLTSFLHHEINGDTIH